MAKLTGTNPDQVPTNADLGTMAYQDKDNVNVGSFTSNGIDDNATSTAMTLDSNGNLLVGRTSTAFSGTGHIVQSNGIVYHMVDGAAVQYLRRNTSDGDIVRFYKDTTEVGSIGTSGGRLYIKDDTYGGIVFASGTNALLPAGTTGDFADAVTKLGASNARWTDLYLSGGVYLGGTASANKLDDYEEGTWTPSYADGSNSSISTVVSGGYGTYVKVGRTVTVYAGIYTSGLTSLSGFSGQLRITGLPFTSYNNGRTAFGSLIGTANTASYGSLKTIPWCISVVGNVSYITLHEYVPSGTESLYSYPTFDVTDLTLLGGNRNRLEFSITYETS